MEEALFLKIGFLTFSLINAVILILRGKTGLYHNCFLGWAIFFYALFFLVFVLWYEAGLIVSYPHLMKTGSPLLFLTGPFFYFFIRSNTKGKKVLSKSDGIHFIPALLQILNLLPFFLLPYDQKLGIATLVLENPYQMDVLARGFIHPSMEHGLGLLSVFGYFFYGIRLIANSTQTLTSFSKSNWRKNWICLAVVLFGFVNLSYLLFRLVFWVDWFSLVELGLIQVALGYLILLSISLLSFYIHLRPEHVLGWIKEEENDKAKVATLITQQRKEADPEEDYLSISEEGPDLDPTIKTRILELFEQEKIFKNQNLSVTDLAQELEISSRDLPKYFKVFFNSDFKSFVNDYRVEEAKAKIESGYLYGYTVESLGELCGFNSRITFFNAFKKRYQVSPSEYRKVFREK